MFLISDGVYNLLLLRGVQLGKNLRSPLLAQKPEDGHHLHRVIFAQFCHELCYVELVHVFELVLQRLKPPALQHLQQLFPPLLIVALFHGSHTPW